ncbi:response regulator [candidate division FCPU426 bacterium]|nr:response regulator [candidate division FCPU426 bacterium]
MQPRILIVDQDIDDAHILKEQFRQLDCLHVYISTNPEVLEDHASLSGFDFAFLDFETMVFIGQPVLAALRQKQKKTVIVLIYTQWLEEVMQVKDHLNADYNLAKPLHQDDLAEVMKNTVPAAGRTCMH